MERRAAAMAAQMEGEPTASMDFRDGEVMPPAAADHGNLLPAGEHDDDLVFRGPPCDGHPRGCHGSGKRRGRLSHSQVDGPAEI